MRTMQTLTAALIATLTAASLYGTPADDRNWATRVKCELQTAGGTSLQDLKWQQGTTPLLSLDQYRSGKAVDATNTVTAIVRFGPSATNQAYFVSVTNYATSGNGYLVQMPTIGTNTAGITAGWWYTAYFEIAGKRYWTGNGRLDIEATTSTGDGLVWQTVTTAAQTTQVYVAQAGTAQVARVADTALAGWPTPVPQTTQVYVAQSGTSTYATAAGTAGTVTGVQSNRIDICLTNTPTLQQVVTAGGTNAVVTNVPSLTMAAGAGISGQRFGDSAGDSASGNYWGAYGYGAGGNASGDDWGAYGAGSGDSASGYAWGAYGGNAGTYASGNYWGAYGYCAGLEAIHTNSHSFGRFAGNYARGNNRMYLDVYSADTGYTANGATNDTIFMDSDGKLYLGGGPARAENPSAGGVLRGVWSGANLTDIPIAGVTGLQGALDICLTNTPTLQQVVNAGGTVTSGVVTIDAANVQTNTYGGALGIGPVCWQAGGATASGNGSWANYGATASGVGSWANYGATASGPGSWANYGATASGVGSWANYGTASGVGSWANYGTASGNGSWANYYGTASGVGSWANYYGTASGVGSWANYYGTASGEGSWAMGQSAVASNDYSFAWNDQVSHGDGSFNIGAPSLLWLQNTNLQTLLDGKLGTNGLTAPIIAAAGGVTNGMPQTLTMTNLTTMADGVYGVGTNGVFFTRSGTNYWILLQ